MAELADALDLGSSSERSEGSSPFIRTLNQDHPTPNACLVLQALGKLKDVNRLKIGGLSNPKNNGLTANFLNIKNFQLWLH